MLFSALVVVTVVVIPVFLGVVFFADMAQQNKTKKNMERTFGIKH